MFNGGHTKYIAIHTVKLYKAAKETPTIVRNVERLYLKEKKYWLVATTHLSKAITRRESDDAHTLIPCR